MHKLVLLGLYHNVTTHGFHKRLWYTRCKISNKSLFEILEFNGFGYPLSTSSAISIHYKDLENTK